MTSKNTCAEERSTEMFFWWSSFKTTSHSTNRTIAEVKVFRLNKKLTNCHFYFILCEDQRVYLFSPIILNILWYEMTCPLTPKLNCVCDLKPIWQFVLVIHPTAPQAAWLCIIFEPIGENSSFDIWILFRKNLFRLRSFSSYETFLYKFNKNAFQ